MSLLFKLQNIGYAISVGTLSVLAVNVEPAKAQQQNNAFCVMATSSGRVESNPCTVIESRETKVFINGKLTFTTKLDKFGTPMIVMGNNPYGIEVKVSHIGDTVYYEWGGFENKYVFSYTM